MARRVKFALEMKDGFQARNNIEEIRGNFDYGKVVGYLADGRLQRWLEDRGYGQEATEIGKLQADEANLKEKLCAILKVDLNDAHNSEPVMDEFLRNRLEKVKQYTADNEILDNIAKVATNQEELLELVQSGESEIYLCAKSFVIPLVVENVTYIGIAEPTAIIRSSKPVDFAECNIVFKNLKFNDEYLKLCEKEQKNTKAVTGDFYMEEDDEDKGQALFDEALEYEDTDKEKFLQLLKESAVYGNELASYFIADYYEDIGDIELAKHWFENAVQAGDTSALVRLGHIYRHEGEYKNAEKYYKEAANKNDSAGMYYLGYFYEFYQYDEKKSLKWYKMSAENGDTYAMVRIGQYCREQKNYQDAMTWFTKAIEADKDNGKAYNVLGIMYNDGEGVQEDKNKAFSYFKKSADTGFDWGMYNLAQCYEYGDGITKNWDKAVELYEKSAEAGNDEAKRKLAMPPKIQDLKNSEIIAELLGVMINGKLKNGTVLWETGGDEEIKSHNFPYRKFSDETVRNFFEHYNSNGDYVIGGLRETNILTSDEYLIFTDCKLIIRDYCGKIIKINYRDIENVSIEGEYNNKLMYETKDGKKRELDGGRSYLWNKYVGLYGIRLYLLIMAKICGHCRYTFNKDEIDHLSRIKLETLNGDSILEYL